MSTMREEIREQPARIEATLSSERPKSQELRRLLSRKSLNLIVLVARGTSDNAAQFGRYLIEIAAGIPVSLAAPSVSTLYRSRLQLKHAVVVAISQSGESTDTNLVLEEAKSAGAFTIGITNEPESSLAKLAEVVLFVQAGKERSVAATKTYTGQLACLYLLAYALGGPIEWEQLQRLPEWSSAALALEEEICARCERYLFMQHAICIGRGLNYANSFELALKLMETCYVVAERFSSADLLHGPIAMVERSFPAFLFCPPGVTWKPLCEMIQVLEKIKADTLAISDRSNPHVTSQRGLTQKPLIIPAELTRPDALTADLYSPIPYIIPAQLLAACLAEAKGLNPDHPRSLTKVTQTL